MDYENTNAMKALRGPMSKRATSAEFNEWNARDVCEYIDALRAQLATARAKAEALDHIAEMVGEKDDPFAAWEVVDHFKRQAEKAATARADALRAAASAGYVACAEAHHVTLGDKVSDRIIALIDKETDHE